MNFVALALDIATIGCIVRSCQCIFTTRANVAIDVHIKQ